MKLRIALVTAVVATPVLAAVGAAAPSYAAATCQGRPATVEGASGDINGTPGNDVIVSTGTDTHVNGLGGDDLICVVGGSVSGGGGNDSILSTAADGVLTLASFAGGNVSYVSTGAGRSVVAVDQTTSMNITMGPAGGELWVYQTSTPGTGTVDFGGSPGYVHAYGDEESAVDLAAQTVSVNGVLRIDTVGLEGATAAGCRVRIKGDGEHNVLEAYGHDIVVEGGGGHDLLTRAGNDLGFDLPGCSHHQAVFRGQGGPDRMIGARHDDVLIGGPGHDVALGRGGVDTCRAEVERGCER